MLINSIFNVIVGNSSPPYNSSDRLNAPSNYCSLVSPSRLYLLWLLWELCSRKVRIVRKRVLKKNFQNYTPFNHYMKEI